MEKTALKGVYPFYISALLVVLLLFQSCIGEDIIDDFVEPELRIVNPIDQLPVTSTHNYRATYFDNVGLPQNVTIQWSSSNENVLTIDANGTITAIAEGSAEVIATVNIDNQTLTVRSNVSIVSDGSSGGGTSGSAKSGTIRSTSSYTLTGDFTLSSSGTNGLVINIGSNYKASDNLPGLYLYLTNNPNSVNGAREVGAVTVFEGEHSYTVANAGINEFKYLLYYCKPFSVKVGDAQIE